LALIKCPDCSRDVSDQAPACPNCGRPFQRTSPALPISWEHREIVVPIGMNDMNIRGDIFDNKVRSTLKIYSLEGWTPEIPVNYLSLKHQGRLDYDGVTGYYIRSARILVKRDPENIIASTDGPATCPKCSSTKLAIKDTMYNPKTNQRATITDTIFLLFPIIVATPILALISVALIFSSYNILSIPASIITIGLAYILFISIRNLIVFPRGRRKCCLKCGLTFAIG
jgi:hypothetical protein